MEYFKNSQNSYNHYGNKRIGKKYELESENTAAWTDAASKSPKTNVSVPGETAVSNSKDWVDNGSRL